MTIKQIMTPNVEIISPDITVKDAAQKMKSLDVGVLPVGSQDDVIGMITDRDITIRCTASGKAPDQVKVSDCMTKEVKFCYEDASINDASKLMRENKIRRLIVLDKDKKVCGIISLGDLVVDGDTKLAAQALKDISKPSEPQR
jgi:CBS domain-containing protein